ncbi:NADH-quinone oxidoreductase subunit G [Planosporangium mesophilum]|uniref:NADH-quinone oxidoreductase n=1 Tax=Planosporangium mesophilum TaxID=689768 RepID=A0A8J3X3A9_9ACTN|nr:NADH-quinone oxidoreductase subunit G [Planosporangium mesophilum]NJC82061.1 NADH-quinone oxidoreductase subunit G [Planosporangium mesophilum]GII26330.1 NADH-quinone oxidoreductase [Planosporangium mesophilum]
MTSVEKATDTVKLTIDGIEVEAPKGALVIRVAEEMGIAIPRFCDHPLLAPAGACRQCLVEVEGQRKPVASCTQTVAEGMVVKTQRSSDVAKKAQEGIMEFLLINHPLDCPMCDKGGECPLQNQAMSAGRPESRFHEQKREYEKPMAISSQVLLDRERCVLCQRCTRFSEEIAGDPFIDLMERGAAEQIGVFRGEEENPADDEPFNSYFSGNTVQICPVGALTGAQYRFRARPFDLVSTPSVCEHCSAGCSMRADHRRGKVMRRLAGDDPKVNEEWNCDKGRWAFQYANAFDRITTPLVRDAKTGELREASWPEALSVAAEGLARARDNGGVGVLTGGRLTVEDAYAYSKFARTALGTNDIDFRARPLSAEETAFLASSVVGRIEATYDEVEAAPAVVIVGLEPEEECPILFLRLRKAWRKNRLRTIAVAPFATRGFSKIGAVMVPAVPGAEASVLAESGLIRSALSEPGAILVVGERLATVPGGLSAAADLAAQTGAKLAWVPRRAGDRGALEAGCLPNLLPGGLPVAEAGARAELGQVWNLETGVLPHQPGRDTDAIIEAARTGALGGLVVAGVDPADLAAPSAAEEALDRVGFLVSIELRRSAVANRADVVFPIAPAVEKAGAYIDWEGRVRPFDAVLRTTAMSDARVLDALAAEMGVELGCGDVLSVRRQLAALADVRVARPAPPSVEPAQASVPAADPVVSGRRRAVLATWHQLIDLGSLSDGDEYLAGTARPVVVAMSKGTAAGLALADGDPVTVRSEQGAMTLPAQIVDDMVDGVVWVPTNSAGSTVRRTLGVTAGAEVEISSGGAE